MLKKRIVIAVILVLAAAGGAFYGWNHTQSPASPTITLFGNVDIRQVSLAFEDSGRVAQMLVEEGDRVQAQQVLAILDSRTAALQLEQANAQVEVLTQTLLALRNGSRPEEVAQARSQVQAIQAEVQRSQLQLKRLQALAKQTGAQAVSVQDLDNAQAQLNVAQAQLASAKQTYQLIKVGPRQEDIARAQAQLDVAKAEQALLQHRLDLAKLRAPQAGVVRARLLEVGDIASAQRPAYTVALTSPKWVRAYVNGAQLGSVYEGMPAVVRVDSAPEAAIAGHVGFISSVAEFTPKTVQTQELRTSLVYEVRVIVDDTADMLRLGMPATVQLEVAGAVHARSGT